MLSALAAAAIALCTAAPAPATFTVLLPDAPLTDAPIEGLIIIPVRGPLDRLPPDVVVDDGAGNVVTGTSHLDHLGADDLWLVWRAGAALSVSADYHASIRLSEAALAQGSTLGGPIGLTFRTRAAPLADLAVPTVQESQLFDHGAPCAHEAAYLTWALNVALVADPRDFPYIRVETATVLDGVETPGSRQRYPPIAARTSAQRYEWQLPNTNVERCVIVTVVSLLTGSEQQLERCLTAADLAAPLAGTPAVGCDYIDPPGGATDAGCAGAGGRDLGGALFLALAALGHYRAPRRRRGANFALSSKGQDLGP